MPNDPVGIIINKFHFFGGFYWSVNANESLTNLSYGKCPKILNTKVTDKMTYTKSEDPDQKEQSDQGLHCFHSTKYFKKQMHKNQNLA